MALKFVRLEESPLARGRQHGETMREEIGSNVEVFWGYFGARGADREVLRAESIAWFGFIEKLSPKLGEELRGIAEGSNLPLDQIVMLNVRHEIGFRLLAKQAMHLSNPTPDGCTAVGVVPTATEHRGTILAQTIDGLASMLGSLFVGSVSDSNKPASLAVYEAGSVGPSTGLNGAGIGFVYNSLLTGADGRGPMTTPFRLRCRSILEARTFDAALRAIVQKDRYTSINYLIGHAEGEIVDIEAAPSTKRYLYPEGGMITHANHFEPGGPAASEWERFLPDTLFRARRLDRHLRPRLGHVEIDHVIEGLKDHFSYPSSICLHPDRDNASGRQASTLSAVIVDLENLRLFATDGPPCSSALQQFDLAA